MRLREHAYRNMLPFVEHISTSLGGVSRTKDVLVRDGEINLHMSPAEVRVPTKCETAWIVSCT